MAFAVIVAFPADIAVTRPLVLTVATLLFDEAQVISEYVASWGKTLALKVAVSSTESDKLVLLIVMLDIGTI